MSVTIEMRDPYTAGHQRRVSKLACAIAREIGLPETQIEGIRMAGEIHDIGKIYVPAEILSKPSKLTDIEFTIIKTHSQVGYDILKNIEFPWPIADIVVQHHERLDGSGYPAHLKGDAILLEANIIIVADVVEAMSSHRPYRPSHGIDKAIAEITQNKGILYDAAVVDHCVRLFRETNFSFE
jgi:putative nucleotidyltransferase with HDIG domain